MKTEGLQKQQLIKFNVDKCSSKVNMDNTQLFSEILCKQMSSDSQAVETESLPNAQPQDILMFVGDKNSNSSKIEPVMTDKTGEPSTDKNSIEEDNVNIAMFMMPQNRAAVGFIPRNINSDSSNILSVMQVSDETAVVQTANDSLNLPQSNKEILPQQDLLQTDENTEQAIDFNGKQIIIDDKNLTNIKQIENKFTQATEVSDKQVNPLSDTKVTDGLTKGISNEPEMVDYQTEKTSVNEPNRVVQNSNNEINTFDTYKNNSNDLNINKQSAVRAETQTTVSNVIKTYIPTEEKEIKGTYTQAASVEKSINQLNRLSDDKASVSFTNIVTENPKILINRTEKATVNQPQIKLSDSINVIDVSPRQQNESNNEIVSLDTNKNNSNEVNSIQQSTVKTEQETNYNETQISVNKDIKNYIHTEDTQIATAEKEIKQLNTLSENKATDNFTKVVTEKPEMLNYKTEKATANEPQAKFYGAVQNGNINDADISPRQQEVAQPTKTTMPVETDVNGSKNINNIPVIDKENSKSNDFNFNQQSTVKAEIQTEQKEKSEKISNIERFSLNGIYSGKENVITAEINKRVEVNQVPSAIQNMVDKKQTKMTLELNPESLGKITVDLQYEQGKLKIDIKTEHQVTSSLLAEHIESLKNSIKTNSSTVVEVNIQNSTDTGFYGNYSGSSANAGQGESHKLNAQHDVERNKFTGATEQDAEIGDVIGHFDRNHLIDYLV